MRNAFAIIAATTLSLGALATAPSVSPDEHPRFPRTDGYFHCAGDTKIHQINFVGASLTGGDPTATIPSWDANPPRGSVFDGEGCGSVDMGNTSNSAFDAAFAGEVTGNLTSVTVRLHHMLLGQPDANGARDLRLRVLVDGESVTPYDGQRTTCCAVLRVTPTEANFGITYLYEFTIAGLGWADDIVDEHGNVVGVDTGGFATEAGDGTTTRRLEVLVGLDGEEHAVGAGVENWEYGFWVWDTTEAPSGITINPSSPADAVLEIDWNLVGSRNPDES